ncbi:Major Facilitator Superfamily protein [Klenkia soli]|uniref:Major Facilitator Superfamily protein n=1 Tax=Klenkia soli TaxID=1052260 RepID=A0A1H0FQD4_9ACTN|nr:MFS transporter [Klenkia soli]SDN96847.1 Major Facilitator Superfamily protein [Klenkia soli]
MTTAKLVVPAQTLFAVVGALAVVEVASGVLQGFYTPVFTDVARALGIGDGDVNWFEAAQLVASALLVPVLARLADLHGHRRVLLASTLVTAAGTWVMALAPTTGAAGFGVFVVGSALQGAYVVWLPLEVAIVHRRAAADDRRTRRAAGVLVAFLQLGVLAGALTSGALVTALPVPVLLSLPAVVVTACAAVVWFGIEPDPARAPGRLDLPGLGLLTTALLLVMGGLVAVRLLGPGSPLPWLLVLAGLATGWLLVHVEARQPEPLVDVPVLVARAQWPVQATAFLSGISVLGAQIPLSTYARADPAVTGYGLGAEASFVSVLIGLYVLTLLTGALLLPLAARLLGPRPAIAAGAALVAVGYALWLPFHDTAAQALTNMAVAGVGSGLLVAALPAAAVAAAPADRTGFAAGMTNSTKTVGGAIASAVFAVALASTGSIDDPAAGAAPLAGYLTVWAICAVSAAVAAVILLAAAPEPAAAPS